MKFDEMNTEELEARQAEILSELENRDEMDTDSLEARADELEAIKAELNDRKAKAEADAELRATVAESNDPVMKTFEREEKKMFEVTSKEYRDLWLRNLQGNLTETEQRDYSSSTTNAVPTIVSDKFFEKMKKLAPMLSEITLLRVAGNI